MGIPEILHLSGSLAALLISLYVGNRLAALKESIFNQIKVEYVSKDLFREIEQRQNERHEYNREALEELKAGHAIIQRRLDEFFQQSEFNRRVKPR